MGTTDFWRKRNVLVTGAGGFVGSWLALQLINKGASVTVLLRDDPVGSMLSILGLRDRVNVIRGSVTDTALLTRVLNEYEVDSCYHLAAQSIVPVANRSPLSTFESNIQGTWCALEACRLHPLIERVVIASSDKAYGSQPVLPYTEEMPLLGSNPYDASKVCADVLARSYAQSYGLPLVVARCANVYGGGDLNFSRLVPGSIRSALSNEAPVIRTDGTPVRDYLYVDDAVRAYLALGERAHESGVSGQAFNFGMDSPISALSLVKKILVACGVPDLEPEIRGVGSTAGEIDQQYLDSSRAHGVLGWESSVELGEGLGRTIEWYRTYLRGEPRLQPEAEIQPTYG